MSLLAVTCAVQESTEFGNGQQSSADRAPSVGAVKRQDRISSMDILRGFALLGILVVNIESFGGPESLHDIPLGTGKQAFVGPHAHLNLVILFLKWIFIEGKMRGLFSALFGAGAVLLTDRIERRSSADGSADIFLRRNMWLMALGFLHGAFLWNGDILFVYGLTAVCFLYPCRKLKAKTLFIAGTIVWVGLSTLAYLSYYGGIEAMRLRGAVSVAKADQRAGKLLTVDEKKTLQEWQALVDKNREPSPKEISAEVSEVRQGGYLGFVKSSGTHFLELVGKYEAAGGFFDQLGPMLVGMALVKSGFFSAELSFGAYLWTAIVGFAISTPLYIVGISRAYAAGFNFLAMDQWVNSIYCLGSEVGLIGIAAVLLILIKSGVMRTLLRPFAAVGQTALSNYLLTSFLCQMLFVFGPWKLYGQLEYYQQLYVVFGVWAINLIVSPLWLKAFQFGPCEWAWRSLTYWKLQPMRAERPAQ